MNKNIDRFLTCDYMIVLEYMNAIKTMSIDKIFKALCDNNRLRILNLLFQSELCVCEIEGILGLSQTNVSRHLIKLHQTGILDSRKEAQWVYYRINQDFIKEHPDLVRYLKKTFKNNDAFHFDSNNLLEMRKKVSYGLSLKC